MATLKLLEMGPGCRLIMFGNTPKLVQRDIRIVDGTNYYEFSNDIKVTLTVNKVDIVKSWNDAKSDPNPTLLKDILCIPITALKNVNTEDYEEEDSTGEMVYHRKRIFFDDSQNKRRTFVVEVERHLTELFHQAVQFAQDVNDNGGYLTNATARIILRDYDIKKKK